MSVLCTQYIYYCSFLYVCLYTLGMGLGSPTRGSCLACFRLLGQKPEYHMQGFGGDMSALSSMICFLRHQGPSFQDPQV